jgi:hypothetical protein
MGGNGGVGRVCLPVQHLLQQVKLCQCHPHDGNQFEHCEILHLVLMGSDDLGVYGLALFLKLLILSDFLQLLPNVNQPRMQLVDLALLGQFQQMRPIVRVKVHRHRFLPPIGRRKTHPYTIPTYLRLVACASELDDSAEGAVEGRRDDDMGGCGVVAHGFVVELDGLAGLLVDVKAEGPALDTEVERLHPAEQ